MVRLEVPVKQAPIFLPGLSSVGANQLGISQARFLSEMEEVGELSWGGSSPPRGARPPAFSPSCQRFSSGSGIYFNLSWFCIPPPPPPPRISRQSSEPSIHKDLFTPRGSPCHQPQPAVREGKLRQPQHPVRGMRSPKKTPARQFFVPLECWQKSPVVKACACCWLALRWHPWTRGCQVLLGAAHLCAWGQRARACAHARSDTGTRMTEGPRQVSGQLALQRETSRDSHSPSLSGHHLGDRWTDRQAVLQRSPGTAWETDRWTDRQAILQHSPGTAWVTDGRTDHCALEWPAGQTAAHRPASSQLRIVCPQAPSCGRCFPEEPEWEAAPRCGSQRAGVRSAPPACRHGRRVPGRLAVLAPSRHPGSPALPPWA